MQVQVSYYNTVNVFWCLMDVCDVWCSCYLISIPASYFEFDSRWGRRQYIFFITSTSSHWNQHATLDYSSIHIYIHTQTWLILRMSMSTFVEITPTKLRDSPSTIRAAIQPWTTLPIPGFEKTFCDESVILSHLSEKGISNKKWKSPKGLFGYSKDSEYKDLYAYFGDYGDQTPPINELATKALAMYGLGGAMGEPN